MRTKDVRRLLLALPEAEPRQAAAADGDQGLVQLEIDADRERFEFGRDEPLRDISRVLEVLGGGDSVAIVVVIIVNSRQRSRLTPIPSWS